MKKTKELLSHFAIEVNLPDTDHSFKQFCFINFPPKKLQIVFGKAEIISTEKTLKTRTKEEMALKARGNNWIKALLKLTHNLVQNEAAKNFALYLSQ